MKNLTLESLWNEKIVPMYKEEAEEISNNDAEYSEDLQNAIDNYAYICQDIVEKIDWALGLFEESCLESEEYDLNAPVLDIACGYLAEEPFYDLDRQVFDNMPNHLEIETQIREAINNLYNSEVYNESKEIVELLEDAGKLINEWF